MGQKLSKAHLDALREIATIGSGNAATALSQMIKKGTGIEVPRVNFKPIDKAAEAFGSPESFITAVYLQLLGDASGVILFCFHKKEAYKLADLLLGRQVGKTKVMTELCQSALKETATILSGAYIGAMAKMLKMRLLVSSPALAQDMAGAIVDNILIETSKEADYALVIDTELMITDKRVQAYFFFIPDIKSLKKILKIMKIKS